jgi:DNA invertase Pin-like site-specific DNA recombinase
MLIGYARVSTLEQNIDLQIDALKRAGCERIYEDHMSGAKAERPGLRQALDQLRAGDTLVVWRLDRLGRSLKDLITRAEQLKEMQVGLTSLQEAIDTSTSGGQLIFHMFGALAEFERNLLRERTMAGLAAARARGRLGGRRPKLNAKQRAHALTLYNSKTHTVAEICELMKITRQTLYNYINAEAEAKMKKAG